MSLATDLLHLFSKMEDAGKAIVPQSLVPKYAAASISGGTIGLALSHAFEAAFIAQTLCGQ